MLFLDLFLINVSEPKEPRESSDGKPLPLSRVAATTLLSKGRVASVEITNLVANYWLVTVTDVFFPQDFGNYVS